MTDDEAFEAMRRGTDAVNLLIAKAVSAERQRIREILWKTQMPGHWKEKEQQCVTWMVAEFDKLICGLRDEPCESKTTKP